jgi:hypothetical protein
MMTVQPASGGATPVAAKFSFNLVGVLNNVLNSSATTAAIYCNQEAATIPINGLASVQFPSIVSGTSGTTASAANAYLDATHSNNLLRSTSARRFKTDIRNLGPTRAWEILSNLKPIIYRSLCSADDPDRQHFGLVAEEVAEVCPELVTYDADGRPANVQYERLAVLLLAAHGA